MQKKLWGPAAQGTTLCGLVSLLEDGLSSLGILDFYLEGKGV